MHPDSMKTLWEIAQSLYQFLDINKLILHIISEIKSSMNVEGVSVILHDEYKNELIFCWAESGTERQSEKLKKMRIPPDKGIAGSVFLSGKAEIIANAENDPRLYKKADAQTGFRTQSMIAAPLQKKRKTIGVLEVLNKADRPFNDEDLTFVTTLAPIIAIALDNARMYGELDGAYQQLQATDKEKDALIRQAQQENKRLRQEIEKHYRFDEIIGESDAMCEVLQYCEKVIDLDIPVLIEGETGTGKELIARCIHYNGPRKKKPLVTQNCGGLPETLLTSELFGHKKGAFTGAINDKKGLFEIAHGGTIFLDEVGEMSPAMQTSMLRVLQDGEIRPLGADAYKKVDARIISATNRDLEAEVEKGNFREDLYYRLNVFRIDLPPLRKRFGDILRLVQHFITKLNREMNKSVRSMHPEALHCLERYAFPGNVRELENEMKRAMALVQNGDQIKSAHLSTKCTENCLTTVKSAAMKGTLKEMVASLEMSILEQLLEKHSGNKTKVAGELGLSRHGLRKKMQRYGIE